MEIENYQLVAILVITFILGIGANMFLIRREQSAELRLSNKILKDLGLPTYEEDSTFSHIFTHKEEKRIELAKRMIEEIAPLLNETAKNLEDLQDEMKDSVKETERIQKEIQKLKSRGAEDVTLMGILAVELQKMAFALKELEYALSSKTQMDNKRIFMKQVALGGTRKEVLDVVQDKVRGASRPPAMGMALGVYREALALAPSEYRKSMETWVEKRRK
jgi:predicted  nucleic acid-binding Zn-ribbon protein